MASTKVSATGFLVESFQGAKDGKPIASETLQEKLQELDNQILEQKIDVNDIDYNDVIENLMPEPLYRAFDQDRPSLSMGDRKSLVEQAEPSIKSTHFDVIWDHLITRHMRDFRDTGMSLDRASQVLAEEGVSPIVASQIDRFRERCQTRTLADFSCPPAATAYSGLFSRINMPCSDYMDNKICEFPLDPPPDLCCNDSNDDDPAEFYGLGPERCYKLPKPCFISFAFAMHRNLVCVNANDFVRSQIEARTRWFDIIDEWKRTRLLFNAYGPEDCDSHPYSYDGVTYPSGWRTAADAAPWVNVIQDPNLAWTTCNEGPMCAIEQVFEDMRDPTNQFPVDCPGEFQVILTRDCVKYKMWEVLGGRTFTRALSGGDCCGTASTMRGPRDGWTTSFIYSRWSWDLLVDFYLNVFDNGNGTLADLLDADADAVALARRTAEHWAENTYVVSKSLASTFATLVDFDVSTRTYEGTNTWMYFDRGIRWARRYDRKQTDGWLRPWLTILVRAFDPLKDVDGGTIPTS